MTQTPCYEDTPWLVFFNRKPNAVARLFCFHYGGGSASAFRQWEDYLPSSVELAAIQLPGRESRFNEPYERQIVSLSGNLINLISGYLDKPYVVFGHSLGAIVGYEWIRALKASRLPQPELFIPSGMPAPKYVEDEVPIGNLPENEFVETLSKNYGETLANLLKQQKIRDVFIPQLRADFQLLENYRFKSGEVFDCPIFSLAGIDEKNISEEKMLDWSRCTTAQLITKRFPGGHFFIHSAQEEVLQTIANKLDSVVKKLESETGKISENIA